KSSVARRIAKTHKEPYRRRFPFIFSCFRILILSSLLAASCGNKPEETWEPTPYNLEIPKFFPTVLNIPADNPLTVEGVELGKALFYDGRLCGYTGSNPDSLMSCATCHRKENAYDVGMNNPRFPNGVTFGRTGIPTPHNAMPLFNLVFNHEGYFWNGMIHPSNPNANRRTLEDVVTMGIIAPHEMNSTVEKAVAAIRSVSYYPAMFEKAFGTKEINIDRIEKAIAQYIRTLVSGNSKFDRYLRGQEQLTNAELRGYVLFTTEEGADCFHCHGSGGNPQFTTNRFYNNGLDSYFADDRDRHAFTGDPADIGAYRAPSLRNIAVTAPYMHDGRFKTLDEVLEFYNTGLNNSAYISPLMHKINQGGALLTPSQMDDLKAFLMTLTDETMISD
ncbi:c-type cytochrome, partial [Bacteroidales bacterium OttesenSCG-928-A14]|nr:c-type cytochrome [Bacteroidales bacterium OttesenSCG-928-A14]